MWLCTSDEGPAGAGQHQICPLCTVEKHLAPGRALSYFDPGRRPSCLSVFTQGRDFWLLVILAAEQAVGEF